MQSDGPITVLSSSPLLSYIPRVLWNEGNTSDPNLTDFSTQSYRSTGSNASVSLRFFGTGIWVIGAYTSRLGAYEVELDGKVTSMPGFEADSEERYQYPLFEAQGLSDGVHEIKITNSENSVFELDYIEFLPHFPESGYTESTTLNHTSFEFLPAMESWQISSTSCNTSVPSGAVRIHFKGEGSSTTIIVASRYAVAVYGQISNSTSPAFATLDSQSSHHITSNVQTDAGLGNQSTQLIYYANDLDDTMHELLIYNNPPWNDASKSLLSVAYAVNFSSSANPASEKLRPHNNGHRDIIVISAIIAASVVAFGIFLLLAPLYKKWRRERGMHVVFDYSIAPRPYPVWFFSTGRGMENMRRRSVGRMLGDEISVAQRRTKPELLEEDLGRPEDLEVVHSTDHRIVVGGRLDCRGSEQLDVQDEALLRKSRQTVLRVSATSYDSSQGASPESTGVIIVSELGGSSSERLPLVTPSPTARVPRAGSDRVDLSYVRPPPSRSQSQTALDWPVEAPPRYREVL